MILSMIGLTGTRICCIMIMKMQKKQERSVKDVLIQ